MKNVTLAFLIALASFNSTADEIIKVCQLGDQPANTVKLMREQEIAESYLYTLHYSRKTEYFFGKPDDSRGLSVKAICAGKRERALVAYGEFTSNYLQGFVLVYNRLTGKLERMDFAEKNPPEWLYLGKNKTMVIVTTDGLGENGGKKYVAYRHIKGRLAEPEVEGMNTLPPHEGYDVIRLQQ